MVHAVDLDPALGFGDLPAEFLLALVDDIVGRRSDGQQPSLSLLADDQHTWSVRGRGEPVDVRGSLAGIAAYLAGRPGSGLRAPTGTVPALPPWL
jgi:maleylpyruvate isomerase